MQKFWILILIAIVAEAIGDIMFRLAALKHNNIILTIGFLIYICGSFVWAISLRHHELSKAIVIFAVINVSLAALGGIALGESVSYKQIIGMILGLAALALIEWK